MDDELLGRGWTSDRPWALLTELTELPERMGGHPGERAAADAVADAFADAGVTDVTTDEFELTRWNRGTTDLAVVDPVERPFEAIALPYSPAGEVEAPVVDVGYGTPAEIDAADVRDAVVVASTTTPPGRQRFVHRMEKFGHAVAAGAAAFVFANHEHGQLPPTGALRFGHEAAAPGVGVSHETGEWLREYADRDGRVKLSVDAGTEPATSQNVHGVVGEPDADEELLLVAHYDAHDVLEGALDNGCGVAVALGAADLLADADLDCRVRVAAVGCEEIGLLGSSALADLLALENVRAVVNVDGAGRHRDLRALAHASDAVADVAEAVADDTGHPVHVDGEPHPFSDHWPFLKAGVPALQLHSQPPDGGDRGRGWGHTTADTRDKVDRRNLRSHAMLAALLVERLADADLPRIDETDLREALVEAGYEDGMRAADVWPEQWAGEAE
jgi:Zn-dependent M28 family amino/carboxypeptidase